MFVLNTVVSLKYLKSKRQTGRARGGDRKGMVLCSSRMAALRSGGLLNVAVFLLGKKIFMKCTDRFGKVKHLKYVELHCFCLFAKPVNEKLHLKWVALKL